MKRKRANPVILNSTMRFYRTYEATKRYLFGDSISNIVKFTRVSKRTTINQINERIEQLTGWYLCDIYNDNTPEKLILLLDKSITDRTIKQNITREFEKSGWGCSYSTTNNDGRCYKEHVRYHIVDYAYFVLKNGNVENEEIKSLYRSRMKQITIEFLKGKRIEELEREYGVYIRMAIKHFLNHHLKNYFTDEWPAPFNQCVFYMKNNMGLGAIMHIVVNL